MTNVEQLIIEKTGINEEQMSKLGNVLQEEFISNGSTTIEIPVKNGYGSINKEVPIIIPISDHSVTGTIISPDEGSWRVIIKKVKFDESGLKEGDQRTVKYSKGWGTDTVHVEIYWSIEKDTTFKAKIEY